MEQTTVVSVVNDLFFSVRIDSALNATGYRVVSPPGDQVSEAVEREAPALVIVDIGGFGLDWEDAIRAAKQADPSVPVLAFGSHKDLDARQRAIEAGADRVVAKSQFVEALSDLVARYARPKGTSDDAQ
ncbi:MAG TPA: response regulator [Ardenticatenaceae bacterium]|nr:response regulator [Ardenticatenaceae bacterium]